MSAEFISDSRAAGCLLVFEGPSTSSPDIFRAVHRPQLEQGYTVVLPLFTYTVYGYEIEEDELPNSMPAIVLDRLTLTHSTSKTFSVLEKPDAVYAWNTLKLSTDTLRTNKHSQLLSNASISLSDSGIAVDCEFAEGNPQFSCVLVCREYDSPLLTVVELPQLIEFPVFITVSDPEKYTFALFGRDSQLGMEEEPVASVKFTLAVSGEIPL